jgi:DNA-binding GntR family transcriptional regulator
MAWHPVGELLQPRALYESLADRLRERILSHEFQPGEPIDEAALLRDYGISRTPVREALKLLHHEGLLTARPRRGMVVRQLEAEELREAQTLYALLRAHAQSVPDAEGPLLTRMLEMARRQLRLAHGPDFRD